MVNLPRFQYLDYRTKNGRMIGEWWTDKDLEGNTHGVAEVLSKHFPKGAGVNLSEDSRSSGRDSNQASTEHESKSVTTKPNSLVRIS